MTSDPGRGSKNYLNVNHEERERWCQNFQNILPKGDSKQGYFDRLLGGVLILRVVHK